MAQVDSLYEADLGQLFTLPRAILSSTVTSVEPMPNLSEKCGGGDLFVKRDDSMGFAFGGNKVRQLEFYLGEAIHNQSDTILITGAVQSNFVRLAAAAANKLGMQCHIQLEERVTKDDAYYRESGNVLIDKLLGAKLHSYPEGEDEDGADRRLSEIAQQLTESGRRPYIIPLGAGHPPLGALGYVIAAHELINQMAESNRTFDRIIVPSGSGNTHAGFLFGLRAMGCGIPVKGICVRRDANTQQKRIKDRCDAIAVLLNIRSRVRDEDIELDDQYLSPGYGVLNQATIEAIILGARTEALMLDPTYSGKAMAGFIGLARSSKSGESLLFIHTGGTPGLFAYHEDLYRVFAEE